MVQKDSAQQLLCRRAIKIALEVARTHMQNVMRNSETPLSESECAQMSKEIFDAVYDGILLRLERSMPITEIFDQHNILPFIGPLTRRGFDVIFREKDPLFVAHLEELAGKSLDDGTIMYLCGFGDYVNGLKEVARYEEALSKHQIPSERIVIRGTGTEESTIALYIPPLPA